MTTGEWPQAHLVAAAAVEANTEQSITAAMTMQSIRLNGFFFILFSPFVSTFVQQRNYTLFLQKCKQSVYTFFRHNGTLQRLKVYIRLQV